MLQLGRLVRGREGMLYFVFGTSTIAVVVAHNIDAGEFVAQVRWEVVGPKDVLLLGMCVSVAWMTEG